MLLGFIILFLMLLPQLMLMSLSEALRLSEQFLILVVLMLSFLIFDFAGFLSSSIIYF